MRTHPLTARIFFSWLIITVSGNVIYAQRPWYDNERHQSQRHPRGLFMYETAILPMMSPDSAEFYLFTRVANDYLQFVFNDTMYSAGYELTLAIKDASENSVDGRIQKRSILTRTYEETNDKNRFTPERFRFVLPPGEYSMYIELRDRESKKPLTVEESIEIPEYYSEPLMATKLLFYRCREDDLDTIREVHPIYPAVRSMTDSVFGLFFYLTNDGSLDTVHLACTITNNDGESIDESSSVLTLNTALHPIWIDLGKPLPFGQYSVSIDLESGSVKQQLESSFTIRWSKHSILLTDLNQTVETLQYLMRSKEWSILNELPDEQQKEMIEAFWAERDPEPATPENELEEEFFQRVAFANENFFTWPDGGDGWRSDRGKVYIIYGPPSEVERPSSGGMSRYEIWHYTTHQRRFVFLDRHGSGDFRLISE